MKQLLDVPDLDEIPSLTDWFEVAFLAAGSRTKTHAQLRDTLTAAVAASAEEVELASNLVFKEIRRRRQICGSRYPFVIEEKVVLYDDAADSEFYKFLLLLVVSPFLRNERRQLEVDELFDNVVVDAVKGYLGEGSVAVRFGWPVSGGRPRKFDAAISWLTAQMNLQPGVGATLPASKDGGVDIVGWKPFNDRKAAYVVILAQCTIRTNWIPKARDIIDMVWLAWLDTGRPVVIALAIPFIIPPQFDRWDSLRRTVGVVFDRLRICQYLAAFTSANHEPMVAWVRAELAKITA